MTEDERGPEGWFAGLDPGDTAGAVEAIRTGTAPRTADWPGLAVAAGYEESESAYYDRLHEVTCEAARSEAAARERADDQQLVHAVRAMDDCRRTANELAERVAEWAGSRDAAAGTGVAYARELAAEGGGEEPADERVAALAGRVRDLDAEADELAAYVERTARTLAPNLSALAGPVLAARLVALAGGLESLAKQPSGTVQVLGAEDALFAHLQGGAPSPKHGVIYTHEYVRNTPRSDRGSAARALAGKLSIAARVDHYGGDRRPALDAELAARIRRIREGGDE